MIKSFSLLLLVLPQIMYASDTSINQINNQQTLATTEANPPSTLGDLLIPSNETTQKIIKPIKRQWEKVNLKFNIDILNESLNLLEENDLQIQMPFKLNYAADIRPAYIKSLQQRLDIYNFSIGLNNQSASTQLYGGLSLTARVTFARFFQDKTSAIYGNNKIYYLNQIPWNHLKALSLNKNDIVRIELSTNGNIGLGDGTTAGHLATSLSFGASRGSSLMINIHRMENERVHVQLNTIQSDLDASLNATAGLFDLGSDNNSGVVGFLQKKLSAVLINLGFNKSIKPQDIHVVDYIFNLTNPDAIAAYNQFMNHVKSYEYIKALNIIKDQNISYTKKLVTEGLRLAEDMQFRDSSLRPRDRAVDRVFKGLLSTRSSSFARSHRLKLLFTIGSYSDSISNSVSVITSVDRQNNSVNHFYVNQSLDTRAEGLKLMEKKNLRMTESLVKVNSDSKTELTDLVFTRNLSDKSLSSDQITEFKKYIEFSVPNIIQHSQHFGWEKLIGTTSKTNGYIRSVLTLNSQSLNYLPKLNQKEIYYILKHMIETYPIKSELLSIYASDSNLIEKASPPELGNLQRDVNEITDLFYQILNTDDPSVKNTALTKLQRYYNLFTAIGPRFLISLIPPNQIENSINLVINSSSAQNIGFSESYGKAHPTENYIVINEVKRIINDKSFDLRLVTNELGEYKMCKTIEMINHQDCLK